jgi:osmoprotectant transport system ATP-binding protein
MRALRLDPEVLLLDEPVGALDPMTRHRLQLDHKAIFSGLARTVVLATHGLHEVAWFADEIVLMREGRLVQRGPLADLLERPPDPSCRGRVFLCQRSWR